MVLAVNAGWAGYCNSSCTMMNLGTTGHSPPLQALSAVA